MLFESPPLATGTETQQISRLYSYLYQMSEQLNQAMNNLTFENFAPQEAAAIQQLSSGEPTQAQKEEINSLKALIIKTADIVRSEMDVLEAELNSTYVAQSEFGTYQEQVQNDIRATAEGVVMEFQYDAAIKDVQNNLGNVKDWQTSMEGFIRMGIIRYEDNQPVLGIAVGQELSTMVINGKEVLSSPSTMSTFTSNRLSFWQGKTEIAYMSGGMLHIPRVEVTDQLVIGNYVLKKMLDDSFGILVNVTED